MLNPCNFCFRYLLCTNNSDFILIVVSWLAYIWSKFYLDSTFGPILGQGMAPDNIYLQIF